MFYPKLMTQTALMWVMGGGGGEEGSGTNWGVGGGRNLQSSTPVSCVEDSRVVDHSLRRDAACTVQ